MKTYNDLWMHKYSIAADTDPDAAFNLTYNANLKPGMVNKEEGT